MTQEHPITPPPELVEQWRTEPEYTTGWEKLTMATMTTRRLQEIAAQAALWGANQELEACVEWMGDSPVIWRGDPEEHPGFYLREARRPKPLSLKEQVSEIVDCLVEGDCLNDDDAVTLRRALEFLPS